MQEAFAAHGSETAALVLEPVNYDQGCIVPKPGFLQLCRDLCDRYGVVLFFDEVLTAFRVALGGAEQYLGVTPDLCVLGKALGGGLPISAVAGGRAIMQHLRPLGRSEMSGTYLAHLTAVLGALAALDEYGRPGFYDRLREVGESFYSRFQAIIEQSGVPVRLQYVGPRFGMYFGVHDEVTNYRQAACKDRAVEHAFLAGCFRRGVYFAVSPHHGFSAAHTPADMDRVLAAIAGAWKTSDHSAARLKPPRKGLASHGASNGEPPVVTEKCAEWASCFRQCLGRCLAPPLLSLRCPILRGTPVSASYRQKCATPRFVPRATKG